MHFVKGRNGPLIDHLLLFPGSAHDDLFDALDFAIKTSTKRGTKREKRRSEPGVL